MWFNYYRLPDKRPTRQEWLVVAWAAIVIFIVLGVLALYLSFGAPPEKAQIAARARTYGAVSLGLASAIFLVKELIQRFIA